MRPLRRACPHGIDSAATCASYGIGCVAYVVRCVRRIGCRLAPCVVGCMLRGRGPCCLMCVACRVPCLAHCCRLHVAMVHAAYCMVPMLYGVCCMLQHVACVGAARRTDPAPLVRPQARHPRQHRPCRRVAARLPRRPPRRNVRLTTPALPTGPHRIASHRVASHRVASRRIAAGVGTVPLRSASDAL